MIREINLLVEREDVGPEEKRRKRRLTFLASGAGLVYGVIVAAAFIYLTFLNRNLTAVDEQITQVKSAIATLKRNEEQFTLLKQKTEAMKKIVDSRHSFSQEFAFFSNLNISGGSIETISLTEAGKVQLDVKLTDVSAIDRFINDLLTAAETKFQQITLTSSEFNGTGMYTLSFALLAN